MAPVGHLRDIGIPLAPDHICVGSECIINVTYNPSDSVTLIAHRLGVYKSLIKFPDVLVQDSPDQFFNLASQALTKMHIEAGGDKSFQLTKGKVDPYISPSDATNIAAEIFGHTGQKVTIKAGGGKPEGYDDEVPSLPDHGDASPPISGCRCQRCDSERKGICFFCGKEAVGRGVGAKQKDWGYLFCAEHYGLASSDN